jgi:hypothetical protein
LAETKVEDFTEAMAKVLALMPMEGWRYLSA